MSILIKGMEMPTSCDDCFLPLRYCPYAMKPNGECPLVPVPPHGRLIDADVAEVISFTDEDADADGKDFYDGIIYAADWIRQQPTIIPAEEGET